MWHVKNILSKEGTFDALFDKFRAYLDGKGLSFNEGKIIDTSFVEAPKQRNTREENERINEHFREPTMPFEALKPTELILKVWLPLTNINF